MTSSYRPYIFGIPDKQSSELATACFGLYVCRGLLNSSLAKLFAQEVCECSEPGVGLSSVRLQTVEQIRCMAMDPLSN